jgi:hypothetical protein
MRISLSVLQTRAVGLFRQGAPTEVWFLLSCGSRFEGTALLLVNASNHLHMDLEARVSRLPKSIYDSLRRFRYDKISFLLIFRLQWRGAPQEKMRMH